MTDIAHHASSGKAPRLDRGQIAVVLVLLVAPWVAFPASFIPRALLDGGDDLLANLPQLVYSSQRLLEGEILWVPELWMGHPLLAEPEFATFYLPKLILLFGPPVVTYAAYLVLHYLAAEIGAYLYLKHIGIGRLGAVFGALAYAYAGFMLGHRAHTMYVCAGAWAPFVLLSFERVVTRGTRRDYLFAALAFAMLPLCGAVQLTVYLAGTILFIAGARSLFERRLQPLATSVAGLIPALLLSALQLVPSYGFARQLATNMRADYELGVMHSFHPLLLPTLALPVPPAEAELYSRTGVVVLCAAAVALARIRSAPILIRAWALLAAAALLLMLGRYFAPLAHLLHGLPVIGVLRGPARHNFEFGLALSVLGAYGVDIAQRAGRASMLRWLGAAAGFSLFSYVAVRLARAGYVADAAAADLLTNVTASTALGAALAFLVWIMARAQPVTRGSRLRWGLVAVAPLLETVWVMRLEARPNPSALGLIEQARSVLSETRGDVRLLSVSLHRGSIDALAGNSVLFHPKVESLQGYSSIAYSAARQVLELDMHGQPSFYHELAFSILPSVFGVTHVVLPSAICDKAEFAVAAEHELCARSDRPSLPNVTPMLQPVSGEVGCTALLTDATHSYRLESTGHALAGNELLATLSFFGGLAWEARFALDLPGSALDSGAQRWSEPWSLSEAEDWGFLVLRNLGARAVALSDTGLYVEREVSLTALAPFAAAELVTEHTRVSADFLSLEPTLAPVHVQRQGPAHVQRRTSWPRTARTKEAAAILEVEARAASTRPGELIVDVHSEPDYDPDHAELVIPGAELGPSWRTFRTEIGLADAPEQFSLRALVRGGGPIYLREARLLTRLRERVYRLPLASNRYASDTAVDGDRITLDAGGRISGGAHLPLRAFEVLLDAEGPTPLDGSVTFGLDTPTRYTPPRTWRIDPEAFNGRARIHHVSILPASVRDPRLFVRVEGTKPLYVHELSAADACSRRGYRNPKRLANGLFLYENPHALPRAYSVGQTVRADDPVSVRYALLDFGVADLGKKAVVGENLPADLRPGSIERADFGQRYNEIVVRTEGGPTLLVINERFDPGWRATIDGEEAAIIPVNGIVRGVVVSPGTHRVRLEYRVPGAVWVGLALAALGLLSAAFAMPLLDRLGWFGKRVDQSP